MAKKFDLGKYLPEDVKNGHNDEQIVRIDLDLIDPDPANFYSLEGIDELAANIELVGLLDALRVRPNGTRYTVVSGHRRRAAILLIRDGGSDQFRDGVPCIVEYGAASPAMRELRLIYANSATRVMSSADLSKQAERVTELLYELKAQGVEFPGRMREHVAAACRVSESKIARVSAIRKNLRDTFRLLYDGGRLSENSAYRLSQETPEVQKHLFEKLGTAVCGMTAEKLDTVIGQAKADEGSGTPRASSPTTEGYDPGKEHTDSVVSEYLAQRAEEDILFREKLELVADTFLLEAAGTGSRQNAIEMLKQTCKHRAVAGGIVDWQGTPKGLIVDDLGPRPIMRTWTETYDVLCQIAVGMLADMIRRGDNEDEVSASWIAGDCPATPGRYLCLVDLGTTKLHEQQCEWDGDSWKCYGRPLDDFGRGVMYYWPLPAKREIPAPAEEEGEDE